MLWRGAEPRPSAHRAAARVAWTSKPVQHRLHKGRPPRETGAGGFNSPQPLSARPLVGNRSGRDYREANCRTRRRATSARTRDNGRLRRNRTLERPRQNGGGSATKIAQYAWRDRRSAIGQARTVSSAERTYISQQVIDLQSAQRQLRHRAVWPSQEHPQLVRCLVAFRDGAKARWSLQRRTRRARYDMAIGAPHLCYLCTIRDIIGERGGRQRQLKGEQGPIRYDVLAQGRSPSRFTRCCTTEH